MMPHPIDTGYRLTAKGSGMPVRDFKTYHSARGLLMVTSIYCYATARVRWVCLCKIPTYSPPLRTTIPEVVPVLGLAKRQEASQQVSLR